MIRIFDPAFYFFLQAPARFTLAMLLLLPAPALAQEQPGYLPEFGCQVPPLGLRLPTHLQGVMKLAPVRDVEILEVEKWEGYVTTRKYVHFPGLTLGLVTFSNDRERYMVSRAEITDARWAEISPFRVTVRVSPSIGVQRNQVGEDWLADWAICAATFHGSKSLTRLTG